MLWQFLYHGHPAPAWTVVGIVNCRHARGLPRTIRSKAARREPVEDVLLNRRPDATERLVDFGERLKAAEAGGSAADMQQKKQKRRSGARGRWRRACRTRS